MVLRILPVAGLLFFCLPVFGDVPSTVTLDAIVKSLKAREQAIDSFEVHGREFVSDRIGNIETGTSHHEFMIAEASGGRREYRNVMIAPDGIRTVTTWYREDGQNVYLMKCSSKSLDVVSSVTIQTTKNTPTRNELTKNPYMTALTPRGVALSELVAKAGSIDVRRDSSGNQIVSMTVKDETVEIVLELSSAYDYLPIVIDFGKRTGSRNRMVVSEFVNIDGIWMPKTAEFEKIDYHGKPYTMALRADRIRVNFAPESNRFGQPKLERGAVVQDNTIGKTYVIGVPRNDIRSAKIARTKFVEQYGKAPELKQIVPDKPLSTQASPDPEGSSLRFVIVVVSIVALAIAIYILIRR